MKKMIALLLVLVLTLCLAACEENPAANTTDAPEPTGTTAGPAGTTAATQTDPAQTTVGAPVIAFSFTLENKELIPGAAFDVNALPTAAFVYEVPSCAFEGTDQVYNYGTIEVTAYDDGTGPVIYSIFLVDANTPTTEGLYLGDDVSRVTELYGDNCEINGNERTYSGDGVALVILIQDDFVSSIEYKMITE